MTPYAKFQMQGTIASADSKISQRTGKPYGQITVATGMAGHEFFVPVDRVNDNTYKAGQVVKITGDLVRDGRNVRYANEVIEHVNAKATAAA